VGGSGGKRDNEPFGGPAFKEERAFRLKFWIFCVSFVTAPAPP
jgi:hypothetical protein